jgi:hypothetical protein
MANKVETIDEREFRVNGKPVYLNLNDKWINTNLTPAEMQTAFEHIRTL